MTTKSLSPTSSITTSTTTTGTGTATSSGVHKRRRKNANDDGSHVPPAGLDSPLPPAAVVAEQVAKPTTTTSGSSSFRNVSACNRCRLRKNRCDQRLPACLSCEKASVKCVGYDPITKREIPRRTKIPFSPTSSVISLVGWVDFDDRVNFSYVHYLETRLAYLESLLTNNDIPFPPAESFPDLAPPPPPPSSQTPTTVSFPPPPITTANPIPQQGPSPQQLLTPIDPALTADEPMQELNIKREPLGSNRESTEDKKLDNLVSDIGLVSFAGASDPRYLGSASGISFARVVFAAVKSSASGANGDQSGAGGEGGSSGPRRFRPRIGSSTRIKGARGLGIGGPKEELVPEDEDTPMGGSLFGLHTKPSIIPAPFPSRTLAERLVNLYFEHANPQIPILHRGEFAGVIDKIYGDGEEVDPMANGINGSALGGTHKDKYLLNIVCAIGAGIFLTGPDDGDEEGDDDHNEAAGKDPDGSPKIKTEGGKKPKRSSKQFEPESYHATAMMHLEAFLSQSKGGLEELQAVLLLAGYALLRPVSPGLWYIVGVAVRLAVDLGLHYEDAEAIAAKSAKKDGKKGKREWSRELRRRLWWCVYSLDRLVSTCVGRPFGISDEVISTQVGGSNIPSFEFIIARRRKDFPSLLDDQYIHPTAGITPPPPGKELPSYKTISHHYFRLRLLQSEILQVLQQQSHSLAFTSTSDNPYTKPPVPKPSRGDIYPPHHPYHLQTPFLRNFETVQCWHKDVDRRLKEWIDTAPQSQEQTGVSFSLEFLELNYWQAKIMLYRPCLSVPVLLAGELGANGNSSRGRAAERAFGGGKVSAEEEERIYLTVAEAGSKVLRLYRQLHRVHQVNYTFLATHHLFMAGISFLYTIWHSPLVRSRLTMDEVDFTILAATSVLGDLVDKCPPAEACRDAFERMSRATVQMCLAGGRGPMSKIVPSGTFAHSTGVAGATGMNRPGMMQPSQQHPATLKEEDDEDDDDDDDEEGGIEEVAPGFTKDFESMTRTFAGSRQHDDYEPMSATTPSPATQEQQEEDRLSQELEQQEQRQHEQCHHQQQQQQHQQQQAEQRKRHPHFDEGFRELFTPAAGGGGNTVPSLRFNQQHHLQPNNPHHPHSHPASAHSPQFTLSPPTHNFAPHHNPPLTFSPSPTHTHNPLPPSLQQHFPSPPVVDQDGMSIDPQLAQPVDWGNLDMSAFGLGSLDWEGDAWSDSGSAGGVAGSGNAAGQGMDLFDGFFFGPGGS
ncbi:hypothetical protein L873DRAFT_1794102 [Choiromyces venosus 120613-1]|uniref:Zn(2)-C6 fungal-type domain-containing protein n=1 Tax=Choiromyces venosus 120613-1 TaxID=1336337 RepID=A0A3N4J3G3_9PEZI|nr:hypothetical protein L873DRAFT_1794102 [Choiromyces venosus 120613-1]